MPVLILALVFLITACTPAGAHTYDQWLREALLTDYQRCIHERSVYERNYLRTKRAVARVFGRQDVSADLKNSRIWSYTNAAKAYDKKSAECASLEQ